MNLQCLAGHGLEMLDASWALAGLHHELACDVHSIKDRNYPAHGEGLAMTSKAHDLNAVGVLGSGPYDALTVCL